jgi:methylmalonyl-CoA mutase N-terminal domain/subunit
LYIDERVAERQIDAVRRLRASRSREAVDRALKALKREAGRPGAPGALMPLILDAVRAYATVGEMCQALRDVWGEWQEAAII